jgi:hypothetical protein
VLVRQSFRAQERGQPFLVRAGDPAVVDEQQELTGDEILVQVDAVADEQAAPLFCRQLGVIVVVDRVAVCQRPLDGTRPLVVA